MSPIYLMLFWHMHQPYYRDPAEGRYIMPWTRLHALKDYYGMVAMLADVPRMRATFNVVPSLVRQIREYASGHFDDPLFELAFKPAAALTADERRSIIESFFSAHRDTLIARFPRYLELYEKATAAGDPAHAQRLFAERDFLDLQVLSQLAWCDESDFTSDPVVRGLAERGHGYAEADKEALRGKEIEFMNRILPAYREAEARGQIEVTTTPYYHPILPLLCDTNTAITSNPASGLPRKRFQHPEDAREQLERAVIEHERTFGRRPRGLWPSEGSVSNEVLMLAAELGFTWAASDEGVLARSLGVPFTRDASGSLAQAAALYAPYRFERDGRSIHLFFRDHYLSDLIAFVYARMKPEDAARDLYQRLRASAAPVVAAGGAPVVSIILDGENAWEYFPRNGREFLRRFYELVSSDPAMQPLTASEALALVPAHPLPSVHPGSWINSNFDVWIGHPEDHRAWELLAEAREFYEGTFRQPGRVLEAAKVELALEELLIAEGSDWCWWFGPEHSSASDAEFDALFRTHLSNVYRALGAEPPDELALPIKAKPIKALIVLPTTFIRPTIDGEVSNYFEWMGAGLYAADQRQAAMHGRRFYLQDFYYGYDEENLYLRVDFLREQLATLEEFEVRFLLRAGCEVHVVAEIVAGRIAALRVERDEQQLPAADAAGVAEASLKRILELRIHRSLLSLPRDGRLELSIALWEGGLPADVLPAQGWLEIQMSPEALGWAGI